MVRVLFFKEMNVSEDIKVVFSKQAAESMEDQEMIDMVTAAIRAIESGQPLPDGVEINVCGDVVEFDEDEISQAMDTYKNDLSETDLERLQSAMRAGDMDTFTEILLSIDNEPH